MRGARIENDTLDAVRHIPKVVNLLLDRGQGLQDLLVAAGYHETAERIFHALEACRTDLRRLEGECRTAIAVLLASPVKEPDPYESGSPEDDGNPAQAVALPHTAEGHCNE